MKGFRFALAFVVVLWVFVGAAHRAYAEDTSISVAPAILSVAANPNDTISKEIQIQNLERHGLPVELSSRSLLFEDVIPGVDTRPFDASSWVSFDSNFVLLDAKVVKKIPIHISVPADASPGGHYAQITIRGLNIETSTKQVPTSIVVPEISASVFISVSGNISESLEIVSGRVFPFRVTKGSTVSTKVQVSNDGNIHNIVTPTIVLVDRSGKEQTIPMQSKVVLPKSTTTFQQDWSAPDTVGALKAFVRLTYGDTTKTIETQPQHMIVTPPVLLSLLQLAVLTIVLYVLFHARNLGAAWRELRGLRK